MDQLIHDLLEVGRIEAGALPLHRERNSVGVLVNALLELFRPILDEKSIGSISPSSQTCRWCGPTAPA